MTCIRVTRKSVRGNRQNRAADDGQRHADAPNHVSSWRSSVNQPRPIYPASAPTSRSRVASLAWSRSRRGRIALEHLPIRVRPRLPRDPPSPAAPLTGRALSCQPCQTPGSSSSSSTIASHSPNRAAAPRASPSSTRRASSPRASGSTSCSTRAASSSSTGSSPTAPPTSASTSSVVPGDGVVTGYGRIDGRLVYVFSQDFTVFGGSLSRGARGEDLQGDGPGDAERRAGDRAQRLRRRADPGRRRLARRLRRHLPPQHARLRRGPADLARSSAPAPAARCTARRSPTSSSWCAGVSYMFVTGPNVVKTVTHEDVTIRGARRRRRRTAAPRASRTSLTTPSPSASQAIRELLGFLPLNNLDDPPERPTDDPADRRDEALLDLVPDSAEQAVRHARGDPARRGRRRVLRGARGATPTTSSAASPGSAARPVGIVANQPAVLAGVLDINASLKAARFIRFCDASTSRS